MFAHSEAFILSNIFAKITSMLYVTPLQKYQENKKDVQIVFKLIYRLKVYREEIENSIYSIDENESNSTIVTYTYRGREF